jgi:hypothetical protein
MQVSNINHSMGNNPTNRNDVASIPSTAGATAISALSATDTDGTIAYTVSFKPMEH